MSSTFNFTKENSQIITHLAIALCCLPLYQFGGEVYKLLLAPYVLYLLFSIQPKFVPALLLHFMNGTTMSFLILLGCLIISIKHIKKLKYYKVRLLFLVTLMPLPFFLYAIFLKMTLFDVAFVVLVDFLFMYFGLFSFFYFVIMSDRIKANHLKYIFITLAISTVLSFFYSITVRYMFFTLPLFFSLMLICLKYRKIFSKFFIVSLLLVIMIISDGITTTLIVTSLIASLISILYVMRKKLSGSIAYVFLAMTVYIVLTSIQNYNPSNTQLSNYEFSESEGNLFDPSNLYNYSKFKLFEDRTPLWSSIYDNYVTNGWYSIPIAPNNTFFLQTIQGTEYESDLTAHNIFLELIKSYGILTGIIISIVFIIMIIKSSLILKIKELNIYLIIISSSIISCGFFGGMVGQYLLLGTFSFLFIGLAGLCYGLFFNSKLTTAHVNENTI